MTSAAPTRVLVVAHRTAATPTLLDEVRARARRSPCAASPWLVPRPYWDPETEEAAAVLELALPLLDEAAGGHVDGTIWDSYGIDVVMHEEIDGLKLRPAVLEPDQPTLRGETDVPAPVEGPISLGGPD